jgi:hypothetical protein
MARITASEDAFDHFRQLHNAIADDAGRNDSRSTASTSRIAKRTIGREPQATAPLA